MVVVAQLVRAPDCGSGGRRFETALPPIFKPSRNWGFFVLYYSAIINTKVLIFGNYLATGLST